MAEGADIAIEEARGLVSNRLLWPHVRDFLWDFAPSIHGSWIGSLEVWKFGSLGEGKSGSLDVEKFGSLEGASSKPLNLETSKLQNLQTSSPRVKRYILESLNVESCFHTFPKEDGSRLLLLDGATLESVAKWLGALACSGVLRRVTNGATVRELKAALPGIYPEVFGYTMYFGNLEALKFGSLEEGKDGSLEVWKFGGLEVEKVGCGLMLQSLSSLPAPLIQRLKLKLPKQMTDMEPLNLQTSKLPNCETSKLPNLQTSIFKLLKLKFPEAYKLCCS